MANDVLKLFFLYIEVFLFPFPVQQYLSEYWLKGFQYNDDNNIYDNQPSIIFKNVNTWPKHSMATRL